MVCRTLSLDFLLLLTWDFLFFWGGRTGKRYSVVSALSDDGLLASDHRAVFAEISASVR